MKNRISLYCNWNVYIDCDGKLWLPSVHAQYLKALKNIGFNEIYLASKISKVRQEEHDFSFLSNEITIIPIPYFTNYTHSIFKLPSIIKAFLTLARKKTNHCYIRTYEPFIWILVLIQRVLSKKTLLCMHYISDPKSAIFSNANSTPISKYLRYIAFLPEYYLTNIASIFCRLSSNGPVPIKNTPFFVKRRINKVIESALLESDIIIENETNSSIINRNIENKKTSILYVGYIRPSKGIDVLIDAVNLLVKDNITNFKVTIIGNGDYYNKISSVINTYNLTEYFEFTGYIPFSEKLFSHYKNSDIFINLSPSETGPRVLLEAGIFGCKLISTDVGYARDIIGPDGIIINTNNSLEAKEAIKNLIYNISPSSSNNSRLLEYTTENFFKKILY